MRWRAAVFVAALLVAGLVFAGRQTPGHQDPAASTEPELVLWLWEHPEDLRFLQDAGADETASVAVAPLLGTLRWTADGLKTFTRRQPWTAPADLPRIAVVRLESSRDAPPWSEGARAEVVERVLAWLERERARSPRWRGLQIDFDARQSERVAYRALLRDLRHRLDHELTLGITALLSWCTGDPWIRDLPVDEAVPMYFRMGEAAPSFRARAARQDLPVPLCRQSYGFSTDEPWVPTRGGRRLYVFNPRPWRTDDLDNLRFLNVGGPP